MDTQNVDEAAVLGLLRGLVEHVRQHDQQPGPYELANAINASLDSVYGGQLGGAVVYNAMPFMRDAHGAGGRLLRSVFGPQYGRLREPLHTASRPDVAVYEST